MPAAITVCQACRNPNNVTQRLQGVRNTLPHHTGGTGESPAQRQSTTRPRNLKRPATTPPLADRANHPRPRKKPAIYTTTAFHPPLHVHPVAEEVDEHQDQKQEGRRPSPVGRSSRVQPGQHHQQSGRGAAVRHHVQHGTELGG